MVMLWIMNYSSNNTDVSEMPSPTDYLNDENTLNEYLDKIDSDNV